MDSTDIDPEWGDIGQELLRLGLTAHLNSAFIELYDCKLVPENMSVETAHRRMQIHAHYPESSCPQRQAALQVLADSGEYVLSSRFG